MATASVAQICHAKVYDLNLDCTAYLESVYGVSYEMRENQIWTAAFELPITGTNDDKNEYCLDNHYVELFDVVGTRIELFRIIAADSVRKRGQLYMRYKCEHALATLLDKELTVEMNAGPGTGATITSLLAMQDTAHWQLGTCSFARNFLHYWIPGTSLLAALWQISGRLYDETWQWTFDTTSHPWTLNLVEPGSDVVAIIDYRLNMQEIKRTRGAQKIVNRLYPRGNGAGVDELTIMSINITGAATITAVEALPDQAEVEVASAVGFAGGSHVYLENAAGDWEINDVASVLGSVLTMDVNLQHTYEIGSVCHIGAEYIEDATSQTVNGIKSYPWKDERYTVAQSLYDAAIARLAVLKDPAYTYKAKAIDLAPLIDEHVFQLGELVRVRDNDLDILTDDRVTVIKKRDVIGKPQDIEVQVSNKVPTFGDAMGNIIYADDLDGVSSGGYYSKVYSTQVLAGRILLSAVPGGAIGAMPNPPSAAGAYLSAEYIGIHDGTNWITYMDNMARLIADDGSGDASFRWDPTLTGAAKLQIKGTVLIEAGDTYDDIQEALAAAAAAQGAADGEIVGFYQDAEPGAGMAFGDIWIDTDGHDPLTSADIYRYEDPAGGSQGVLDWYAAPTNAVGLVYLDAAGAQSTADGKITTFYQDAEPTGVGESEGDFWVDTNDSNKTYVYSGAAWVETSSADAIQALADAAQAQSTADGKIIGFYQDAEPGAGMAYGDIWIDTNGADPLDTTCIYRYQDATGGYTSGAMTWVNEPTNAIGAVYLNAASAEAAADGKITTFYQAAEPTADGIGDLWVDTDDYYRLFRWDGATWKAVTGAVASLTVIGNAWITDLAAGKITAGDITVGLNVNTGGYIQSNNYAVHSAGWKIFADGSAEFNDVWVRGTLNASDISAGTLSGTYIGDTTIVPGKLNINATMDFDNQSIYNLNTLRGGTGTDYHIIYLDSNQWTGYGVSPYAVADTSTLILNEAVSLRAHGDLTLDAQAGDLVLKAGDDMWFQVGGGTIAKLSAIVATDSVSLKIGHEGLMTFDVGGVTRYLAFREAA